MATDDAAEVLDLALLACDAYGRDDLVPRLTAAKERLASPSVRILVVGEFKQGKSTLVNALVGHDVCPVDDDIATSVPTGVGWAAEPRAVVWRTETHDEPTGDDELPRREEIDVSDLHTYVTEGGNPGNERRLRLVEIGVPSPLLELGLTLVDTPGVGGLGSAHGAVTVAALPTADAVLLVTDASQELTAPELRFLANARDLSPAVAVVLTKRDLYPSWRQILDLDRGHLDRNGFASAPLIPVASPLVGVDEQESGVPAVAALLEGFARAGAQLQKWSAGYAVHEVARHLEAGLLSTRDGLTRADDGTDPMETLRSAQQRADRLRAESARWQVTLTDGLADLTSDVDHDLRRRLRTVTAEADARIDDGDPGDWWDEFQSWLRQRLADEVTAAYVMLAKRAEELSAQVAEHFAAAEEDVDIGVDLTPPMSTLADLDARTPDLASVAVGIRARTSRATATGLTAIRGSYGGVAMFGMLGSMIGMAALSPALLGVGVLMGRRAVRDEKVRLVAQRRQQARTTMHRYLEDIGFQVGKELRDATRRVGRQLRDGFAGRAEELQRTTTERVEGARDAALTVTAEREQRLADIDAELARVRALAARGDVLMTAAGT